jgi:hypothetical protein
MPALGEWQYALDDHVFGYGTPWPVYAFDVGYPDVETQDIPVPREDGVSMGVDRFGSMTISIDFEVDAASGTESEALNLLARIRRAWYGTDKRLVPQSYQVLSYRTGGSGEQRRVYGRGRTLTPATLENVHVGVIPCSAQFQCRDPFFYSDTEFSDSTPFIPAPTGGLVFPTTMPFFMAGGGGSAARGFEVRGEEPAWIAIRINGPLENPVVEVVGQYAFQLLTRIPAGDAVIVDPQPWSRTVRRASDGANMSGRLSGTSAWLADMRVPPGFHEIVLRGSDPTGTSSVEAYWRTVRASL